MKFVLLSILLLSFYVEIQGADLNWWKTAVFYQIYPRSFKDSDNDGVGDIRGIIEKIDHLVDAGITAIWLSPIYKSPQVDHGYDISNFTDVDPLFGNLTTLKELVNKCHVKGIKVILDFVPNHSSDKHEWFSKSENNETGYINYYVWKNGKPSGGPPNNWISHFHGSAWKYSDKRKQYYLHQFADGQPDLNYRDPKLVQEMKNVLLYWLDFGVDGFRMDIVPAIFEHPDLPDEPLSGNPGSTSKDHGYLNHIYTYDQPETYDMIHQWRVLLDNYQLKNGGDARVMMVETYSDDAKALAYYGNATHVGAHFPFNFWFITKLGKNSNAKDIKTVVEKWLNYTNSHNYTPNWVLGNHDQHRVASRYGTERIDGLAMLSLLLPGVSVIYNGEEIGMEDGEVTWKDGTDPQACLGLQEDFAKNSRDFQRTPYHWNNSNNAGFNAGNKTWLPVSSKYKEVNLQRQLVPGLKSHYRIYQALIKTRKAATIKYGKTQLVALSNNSLALVRTYVNNPTYLVVVNVGSKQENVSLNMIAGLPANLTVSIVSLNSTRSIGDVIRIGNLTLQGYEAILAIENITNSNSTNNNNNNSNNTNSNKNNGIATVDFNVLLVIFMCTVSLCNV